MLLRARRVQDQKQRQRGRKVYSLHAPEVECIGKGKAQRRYEFGIKLSVATTLAHVRDGQFVTHVKALLGNPYDGHTLATVIAAACYNFRRLIHWPTLLLCQILSRLTPGPQLLPLRNRRSSRTTNWYDNENIAAKNLTQLSSKALDPRTVVAAWR
jgi:hypothetical protein